MTTWDESKRLANLAKHAVDFHDLEGLAWDEALTFEDRRKDYGERRNSQAGSEQRRHRERSEAIQGRWAAVAPSDRPAALRCEQKTERFFPQEASGGMGCFVASLLAMTGLGVTERRLIAMAPLGARLHVVVYVERAGERRVISARKANSREVALYENETRSSDG